MIVGQRIKVRLKVLGISQAELARRVGMSQSGMVNLIAGRSRTTSYLHKIARALRTTVEYLTGEIDDPDAGAPAPPAPPQIVHVMLPVALPPENALAEMFEALLLGLDQSAPADELARGLAELLPTGLSQLRGPFFEMPTPPRSAPPAAAPALATAGQGPPR